MEALYHFSDDPAIERFEPHVPATNPTKPPAVWAIDAAHAPLYWFPRDCPRVMAWPRTEGERLGFESAFHTTAPRLHAVELGWLQRVPSAHLFRYRFDALSFSPSDASGQWISGEPVEPVAVEPSAMSGRPSFRDDPLTPLIRPATIDDHDAIRQVVADAFGSDAEADLVDRIRASHEYQPSMDLVALVDARASSGTS